MACKRSGFKSPILHSIEFMTQFPSLGEKIAGARVVVGGVPFGRSPPASYYDAPVISSLHWNAARVNFMTPNFSLAGCVDFGLLRLPVSRAGRRTATRCGRVSRSGRSDRLRATRFSAGVLAKRAASIFN